MNIIKLNDILRFDNLNNIKIRFNLMFANNWNPIEIFKNNEIKTLLEGQYWNYNKNKSYKEGQITIGFTPARADIFCPCAASLYKLKFSNAQHADGSCAASISARKIFRTFRPAAMASLRLKELLLHLPFEARTA